MTGHYYKYKPLFTNEDGTLDELSVFQVLEPVQKSYYFLPTRKQLNDPTEGTFENQVQRDLSGFLRSVTALGERHDLSDSIYSLLRQISHSTDNSGVFSLSCDPVDELMWAHYANSHCGVAIEYDISLLTRFSSKQHLHCFDVIYSNNPPELGIEQVQNNAQKAVQSMLGYKSPAWLHESEYRVLLENINGQIPHDYRAVKSITFGYRVEESVRQYVYENTKNKVSEYFEIVLEDNSYNFVRKPLPEYSGTIPKGNTIEIDWSYHLTEIENGRKNEFIQLITNEIKNDPHFGELNFAEKSTTDPTKVVVSYEAVHDIPLESWTKHSKQYYPL